MSSHGDRRPQADNGPSLKQAMRAAQTDAADRMDSVVALADMERARLDQLAEVLAPVFRDVPADDDQFDLALSQGLRPRLLIDATAHVAMGRDRQTYRFVQDTRRGRTVLAETRDPRAVAERVTAYIAARIVERRQQTEGTAEPLRPARAGSEHADLAKAEREAETLDYEIARERAWDRIVTGALWFLIGGLAGGLITYAFMTGAFGPLPGINP